MLTRRCLTVLGLLLVVSVGCGPDADTAYKRGLAHANGDGVPKDDAEAAKWFRLGADQGLAEAQFALGGMYGNGRGVTQDDVEAARWVRRAADQGLAVAQASQGAKYAMGQGLPRDYVLAYMWLNLAAAQPSDKHEEHIVAREGIEGLLTPAQLAEAQRLAFEWTPKPER